MEQRGVLHSRDIGPDDGRAIHRDVARVVGRADKQLERYTKIPFIPNAPDDEEQPGQGAVTPGAGGVRTSPGGIGSTPSASSAPAPKDAGGQFATLQSYLTANQGQAAPLAGKITSGIQNQYNTLQGQNASTLSGIQGQVAQGATPLDQNLLAQEAANPVSFASNPGNVQSFQGQLNAKYTGPQSAESSADYQKQQAAVNNAIATGNAQTGTEVGREQLLTQTERRPTTGVTALNSAILTQSPDYLSQVQDAYKPFSNLVSGLSSGAADINKQIAQNVSSAQTASQTANKQISDQSAALASAENNALTQAQNQVNQYNTALPGYNTGRQSLQQLLQNWNNLSYTSPDTNFGFKAAPIVDQTTWLPSLNAVNVPTQNQVSTADQLATQQALNALSGQNLSQAIDPNATVGGFTSPAAIPTLQPTADQLYNELQQAGQQTYNQYIKNAPWDMQWQYQNLLNTLNQNLAGVSGQLKQYDPLLNPIQIAARTP